MQLQSIGFLNLSLSLEHPFVRYVRAFSLRISMNLFLLGFRFISDSAYREEDKEQLCVRDLAMFIVHCFQVWCFGFNSSLFSKVISIQCLHK